MMAALLMVLAITTCTIGFTGLALAMQRHYRQVTSHMPSSVVCFWFRVLGVISLMISFALCVVAEGYGTGMVLWFGIATASVLGIVMVLSLGFDKSKKK